MTNITKTTRVIGNKKLTEQAMMLRIRFRLLMQQRVCQNTSKTHAAIDALTTQLNVAGPSYWLRDNFTDEPGCYAGYWWHIVGEFGAYRVRISTEPPAPAHSAPLVLISA